MGRRKHLGSLVGRIARKSSERWCLAAVRFRRSLVEPLEQRALLSAVRALDGFEANSLARGDDPSTGAVELGFEVNLFGRTHDSLYVNTNGNVTFDAPLNEYRDLALRDLEGAILAPFWADVDTTNELSGVVTYGSDEVDGRSAFGVNWIDVGYFDAQAGATNRFQLVLIDRSDVAPGAFDAEFNYDRITWDTSTPKAGGGTPIARAGFSAGTGEPATHYELIGSGYVGTLVDGSSLLGLVNHHLNSDEPGRYVFEFRHGTSLDDLGLAGQIVDVQPGLSLLGSGTDPDAFPIAQPTNGDAADTIHADQLRSGGGLGLDLSGDGLHVGIWEAREAAGGAHVRSTHRELAGRVTIGDSGSPLFSDHATHVAGTLGATGLGLDGIAGTDDDLAVQGMAYRAQLFSFDVTDYLAELPTAIQGDQLVASNHSWAYAAGWDVRAFAALGGQAANTWFSDRLPANFAGEDPLFGQYGDDSRGLDEVLHDNPGHLAVFSAGNDGARPAGAGSGAAHYTDLLGGQYVAWFASPPVGGFLAGLPAWWLVSDALYAAPTDDGNLGTGFDSIPSGGATAKNSLTVGAVNDLTDDPLGAVTIDDMAPFSSWGPTDDGRIKPDVVAGGVDLFSTTAGADDAYESGWSGTSMAAAGVTGAAVLLIEHFENLHGRLPRSATTKGLMIHTAVDAGNPGPDYSFGWGVVDAAAAVRFLSRDVASSLSEINQLVEGTLEDGAVDSRTVDVQAGEPLKVTLVWTDPAGTARTGLANLDNPARALVNDLDLTVTGPGGTTHLPWTLNPANPAADAVRTQANHVDNVEQVLIDAPATGTYTIRVSHSGALQDGLAQDYSLLISAAAEEEPDRFEYNDTPATATVLGSEERITLRDLTIHNAGDVDFFRVTGAETGKMVVNAFFLHPNGDLHVRVEDARGNQIALADSADDHENLVVPVVARETYYVVVFGVGGAVNAYDLEIETFAAPVPDEVDLPARDQFGALNDTGASAFDDITNRTDPEIIIEADLRDFVDEGIALLTAAQAEAGDVPGAAVEVFVNGNSAGYAEPIANTGDTLFRFAFAEGALPIEVFPAESGGWLHYVKAAVRIFDGRRDAQGNPEAASGRTRLSTPLLLTVDTTPPAVSLPDMLASSDSGRLSDDDVTSVVTPAFAGTAERNARLRILARDVTDAGNVGPWELVGRADVEPDVVGNGADPLGSWEVTIEPLADRSHDGTNPTRYATYRIVAEAQDLAGNVARSESLQIWIDRSAPSTPYLDLAPESDSGRSDHDNVTNDATPTVTSTIGDTPAGDGNPFPNDLVYRIYDRPAAGGEVLRVDSFATLGGFTAGGFFSDTLPELADGVHNLRIEVEDRAGNRSADFLLQVTIDTVAPAVSILGIDPASTDSGVAGVPATWSDRITNDTATGFFGETEAGAVVRMWADGGPVSDGVIDASDVYQGLTVAVPLDGGGAFSDGQWRLAGRYDLNDPDRGFPLDGLRQIAVTAEDLAGNVSEEAAVFNLFVDTQGPRVTAVRITDDPATAVDESAYNLFAPKPSDGPTPLVRSLSIDIEDLPGRAAGFLYEALAPGVFPGHPATHPGHYRLEGDANGRIAIASVAFEPGPWIAGEPATGTIVLTFARPLPDDRYTLTVSDALVDPAGNALDGESNAVEPHDPPTFPSGDGQPGGDFVARFTVDSRAEIGVWAGGSVYLDLNGNFRFDPDNPDPASRDVVHLLGYASDYVFAGNFAPGAGHAADGFDKLAAYGKENGRFRWLIDFDNDGVPDAPSPFVEPAGFNGIGIPIAGNFDGNFANGDEVGLFTGTHWLFDTNHNFLLSDSTPVPGNMRGYPIVGHFDDDNGDGRIDENDVVDFATWDVRSNTFQLSLSTAGGGFNLTRIDATHTFSLDNAFQFIGVRERPVAADMDGDGFDDVGLWVPDRGGMTPRETAEWYFLVSGGQPISARLPDFASSALQSVPFRPAPFGNDLFAQFGDDYGVPVVGNFDPPVVSSGNVDPIDDPDDVSTPAPVELAGTPGDDVFWFEPGATPGTWVVTLNGVRRELAGTSVAVTFDGKGGNDKAILVGTDGNEQAELWPRRATFAGDGFTVSVDDVESIWVQAAGGDDLVVLHDSAGADRLGARPDYATMYATDYCNRAIGFRRVEAYATPAQNDAARLIGSGGDDAFEYEPFQATLTHADGWIRVVGFRTVYADGSGGEDAATFRGDPNARDVFTATPDYARLRGAGWIARGTGFQTVSAFGSGGSDAAMLYGSATTADTFVATPAYGELSSTQFTLRAEGFARVYGHGLGGNDLAMLYDRPGTQDVFASTPDYAKFYGPDFCNRAIGFRRVEAHSSDGADVARLYDSALEDHLEAGLNWVRLSNRDGQLAFSLEATGFGSVKARSSNDGDTKQVDPKALDWLVTVGWD